jgi:hypothetical protein
LTVIGGWAAMSYFSGTASAVDGLAIAVRLAAQAASIKSNKAFRMLNQSGPLGADGMLGRERRGDAGAAVGRMRIVAVRVGGGDAHLFAPFGLFLGRSRLHLVVIARSHALPSSSWRLARSLRIDAAFRVRSVNFFLPSRAASGLVEFKLSAHKAGFRPAKSLNSY